MIRNEKELTRLIIKRKRQLMEANVPVDILVNGYLAAQLKNGETKEVHVYTHDIILLEARLMMNKTEAFTISEEERGRNIYEVSHVISNPMYIVGILLAIVSTIMVLTTGHPGYMVIVAPPAALFAYLKFVKKSRYLRISPRAKGPVFQHSEN